MVPCSAEEVWDKGGLAVEVFYETVNRLISIAARLSSQERPSRAVVVGT